jgi:hypothetical protein
MAPQSKHGTILGIRHRPAHPLKSYSFDVPKCVGNAQRKGAEMDMTVDLFAQYPYGKAALKQLGDVPENFRLFEAGWLGKRPEEFRVMEVKGAQYRPAKTGANKGKLTILVQGTTRTAYVTKEEIRACDETQNTQQLRQQRDERTPR